MQITIPTKDSKVWTQRNDGEYSGILNGSRNIDLTRKGIVKLADRMSYIQRYDASTSTYDETQAIVFGDFITTNTYKYWFVTTDKIYTMGTDYTGFAIDATGSSPQLSIYSDGVAFSSGLYVTTSAQLCKLVAGTWTVTGLLGAFTNQTSPHPVEPVAFMGAVIVGDKNIIHKYTSSGVGTSAVLSLPTDYEILWLRATGDRVFIGTRHLKGLNAKVFEWDGTAVVQNAEYEIESTRALSGILWKGTLYVFTLDGRLLRFNGNGFSTEAQLPYYKLGLNTYPEGSPIQITTQRGMITADDEILVSINPQILDRDSITGERTYANNTFAGIWAYSPDSGLYHKYGFTIETSAPLDYSTNYQVKARAIFKVPEDITISSTTTTYNSILMTGYTPSASGTNYHFASGLKRGVQNRGMIALQKIDSFVADENWQSILIKFGKVYSSEDVIVIKYKVRERDGLPFTTGVISGTNATWTASATFTSVDARFAKALVGDEVTILSGYNAGACAHISTITYNTGTYTIVLDESIGYTSGNTSLLVEPYLKLGTITSSDQVAGFKLFSLPSKNISRSISIKCEMRGEDIEIEEIVVSSKENINPI